MTLVLFLIYMENKLGVVTTSNMRFTFGNLSHWKMYSGWKEKLKENLWQQVGLPLTTTNMEVLSLLTSHNLQG